MSRSHCRAENVTRNVIKRPKPGAALIGMVITNVRSYCLHRAVCVRVEGAHGSKWPGGAISSNTAKNAERKNKSFGSYSKRTRSGQPYEIRVTTYASVMEIYVRAGSCNRRGCPAVLPECCTSKRACPAYDGGGPHCTVRERIERVRTSSPPTRLAARPNGSNEKVTWQ